jgi:hypothetical protein
VDWMKVYGRKLLIGMMLVGFCSLFMNTPLEAAAKEPLYTYIKIAENMYSGFIPETQKIVAKETVEQQPLKILFSDVPQSADYFTSVHVMRDLGIISGYPNGTFKPSSSITRYHAGLLVERLYQKSYVLLFEEREAIDFADVKFYDESSNAMELLYSAGFVEVDAKKNIQPNKALTRGEMAKIIAVAFRLELPTTTGTFPDVKGKSVEPYVEALKQYGITKGYPNGNFQPNSPITRAQYTQFLHRALMYFGEGYQEVATNQEIQSNFVPYEQNRWAQTETSFLYEHQLTNNLMAVEALENKLVIHQYDANGKTVESKEIPFELPIFGTFYAGETYNYVAYGQENKEEKNQEVIRIVKYDQAFNRIAAGSIYGHESIVTVPFDAATGQMREHDGKLVFHTSRERYTSSDGKNHQSQLTIIMDTTSMRVMNSLEAFQTNHVSHSFHQFVLMDGQQHVLLDHGDAFPRSLVIHKGDGNNYQEIDLVQIPGPTGANQTGVSVGGFVQSASNYLAVYNEVDQAKVTGYTSFDIYGTDANKRDVKLAIVAKDLSKVQQVTLATYTDGSPFSASVPSIVPIEENAFIVLWQQFDVNHRASKLMYVKVDENGKLLSDIQYKEGVLLSKMQPIYKDGQLIWFINEAATETEFYKNGEFSRIKNKDARRYLYKLDVQF